MRKKKPDWNGIKKLASEAVAGEGERALDLDLSPGKIVQLGSL